MSAPSMAQQKYRLAYLGGGLGAIKGRGQWEGAGSIGGGVVREFGCGQCEGGVVTAMGWGDGKGRGHGAVGGANGRGVAMELGAGPV